MTRYEIAGYTIIAVFVAVLLVSGAVALWRRMTAEAVTLWTLAATLTLLYGVVYATTAGA